MRIITGQYKGRRFDIPRTFKARPTTDFAKENIFNVLSGYVDFDGATALDLFAGTGSISLEMLSRGCSQVVSVEADRDHARFIGECVRKLQVEYAQDVLRSSAAKAAQALVRQLDSNNEWVVQNAASRILQYIQTMEDNQDATITVAFTSMPAPVLPSQTAVPTEGAID